MTMTTHEERVSKLEQKVSDNEVHNNSAHERIAANLIRHDADLKAIRTDVHAIRLQMEKFKGFWSGVIATIGVIAASLGAALMALWEKITGGGNP